MAHLLALGNTEIVMLTKKRMQMTITMCVGEIEIETKRTAVFWGND